MSSKFLFRGVEDENLEREANQRLARLMDGAPYDSSVAALLEKGARGYWAAIDIYSTHGPFVTRVSAPTAREAVDRSLTKIAERLEAWRLRRFSHRGNGWSPPTIPDVGVA